MLAVISRSGYHTCLEITMAATDLVAWPTPSALPTTRAGTLLIATFRYRVLHVSPANDAERNGVWGHHPPRGTGQGA